MSGSHHIPDSHQLVDKPFMKTLTRLSGPTLDRLRAANALPKAIRIGRSLRWRLRTGDPATGVLDWVEAGCPCLSDVPSPESQPSGPESQPSGMESQPSGMEG